MITLKVASRHSKPPISGRAIKVTDLTGATSVAFSGTAAVFG
jgi:hypothetical protein